MAGFFCGFRWSFNHLIFALCLRVSFHLAIVCSSKFQSLSALHASNGQPVSRPSYELQKFLVIGALIPEQATTCGRLVANGFLAAIQDVNNRTDILPRHTLQPIMRDTGGDTWLGFQHAASVIGEGHAVAIVGPGLSRVAKVVSPLASRCQIPFVTPSSTSLYLSFHEVHQFILQLCPSSRVLSQVVIDVIREFGWTYVAVIKSDGEHGENALYHMDQFAAQQGLSIIKVVDIPVYSGSEHQENRTAVVETLKRKMKCLVALRAHIFVLSVLSHQLELVLQAADDLDLIGEEFVWIIDSIESPEELMRPKLLKLLQGSLGISTSLPRSTSKWERTHKIKDTSIYQLYAYDAVWLIARALHQFILDGNSLYRRHLPGVEGSPKLYELVDGQLLLDYIRNMTFEGVSGTIHFDRETGERVKTYNIVNMFNGSFSIVGKWSSAGSSRQKRLDMGGQYPYPRWYNGSEVTPADRDISTNQVIAALALISEPYIFYSNSGGNEEFSGYLIDMMNELSHAVGFNYSLTVWNGSYDDALSYISQGNHPYTLVVADMTVTAERSKVVQFSQSYLTVQMSLLVERPSTETAAGIWGFLAPFSYKVWLLVLGFFLFGAVVLRVTEAHRRKHPDLKFGESLWISFSCLFGTHEDDKVTSVYGRIWLQVMLLTLLVLTAVYTAMLTGFLLSKELKLDVAELQDLLNQPVGTTPGTSVFTYLRDIEGLKNIVPVSIAEATPAIVNGTVKAFIFDRPSVQHIALHNCSVYVTKFQFHPSQLSLAFQRGSALLDPINKQMQSFWESGYLNRLYDRHFVWFSECEDPDKPHMLPQINIEEISGIFIVLAITVVVCFVGHFITKRWLPSLSDVCVGTNSNKHYDRLWALEEEKQRDSKAMTNNSIEGLYVDVTYDTNSDSESVIE